LVLITVFLRPALSNSVSKWPHEYWVLCIVVNFLLKVSRSEFWQRKTTLNTEHGIAQ
jgi:hypothetical protein